ncbi:hypothetical protein D1AOALGA4SA_11965 [Olavius algarvensis Delta 1 endosymbiont]|nr:hypothetical protein D1AOALGA4SA_11965 [Olavius algarvensis Delta 1 endosymbiont]
MKKKPKLLKKNEGLNPAAAAPKIEPIVVPINKALAIRVVLMAGLVVLKT